MISVLMATYNGSQFIIEQLDSIKNQTFQPDEVIICDDCSTDDTVSIVSNYISNNGLDNWKLYVNEQNLGHYKTFLKLSQLATNEYVFFSDQDDIWNEKKIERMLSSLEDEQVSMVFCKSNFINEMGVIIDSPVVKHRVSIAPMKKMITSWPSGYQTAIRKTLIDIVYKNSYFDRARFDFHDVLFGMVAPFYGDVVEIDEILDSHRIHLNNATLSSNSRTLHNNLENRLDYYRKMESRYCLLKEIAEYQKINFKIEDYVDLYKHRINFIKTRSIISLLFMIKKIFLYNGFKAFLSDLIYAFRINEFLSKLIKDR